MQTCLATGATCMIDIHNFARWNGGIIGQGGPTDDQFVSLWQQLAAKYAGEPQIIFGLMNEPHHLDVGLWAATCQKVVTAIRNAGATSQMILLPGTDFDSAASLVSSGSAEALMAIRNPDGGTAGLLLDIHKYLDVDNSGTHAECVTDNRDAFATVASFLRQKGRQGFVSETGASSHASVSLRPHLVVRGLGAREADLRTTVPHSLLRAERLHQRKFGRHRRPRRMGGWKLFDILSALPHSVKSCRRRLHRQHARKAVCPRHLAQRQ